MKLAAAIGALCGAGAVAGFAPAVRLGATSAAARLGVTVEIERVLPTWGGVRLRGVRGRLEGVGSLGIGIDEVEVRYTLAGRRVTVRGGRVDALGPRDVVLDELRAWRARRGSASTARGGGDGAVDVGGVDVTWKDRAEAPGEALEAREVRLERGDAGLAVSAAVASVSVGPMKMDVTGPRLAFVHEVGGATRLSRASASGIDAEIRLASGAEAPAESGQVAARAQVGSGGGVAPDAGRGLAARVAALRSVLARATAAIDGVLSADAQVELGGVRARLRIGDDSLGIGPGVFRVRRADGRVLLELSPGEAASGEQALTFRVAVPAAGAGGDVEADVAGGPIALSTLGVHEGDFGLLDVGKTALDTRSHVVVSADGRRVTVDGEGKLRGLSLRNAALSDEAVRGLELAWKAKGAAELDGSRLRVDEGEVDLGAIRVRGRGSVEPSGDGRSIEAELEVPRTACQSMLDSVPRGLAPKLVGMRMAGSFGLRARGRVDTARIDRAFRLEWDVANSCRVTEAPPEVAVERFAKPFTHPAYGPDGERIEIESGPGTSGWTPIAAISKFMEVGVLTTEDGGFHRHHGFDEEAIRNSIRENLRKGRFVRGASTISMQLAKNLYLDRTKNLSRKLQEAVLTMYLEQELTKEQILELYFNVIELGPMVYGVGPAAHHYFSTSPMDLSLSQALYLSSILPNPKVQHFAAGGEVSPSWTRYLRMLMRVAHARKRLTDEELDDGLRETAVRGAPSPKREPRSDKSAGGGLTAEPEEGAAP
jgi:hypothetical protein